MPDFTPCSSASKDDLSHTENTDINLYAGADKYRVDDGICKGAVGNLGTDHRCLQEKSKDPGAFASADDISIYVAALTADCLFHFLY